MLTLFKQQVSEMVPQHCDKILSGFYDNLDISNVFNTTCRALTLDVLSGHASRDYACGLKQGDAIESTCETLSNMFGYFHAMRTCHAKLRYFDWDGQVHLAKGKTGGQQGDPLEMLEFNLTTLQSEVLADLKHVLKEDAALDLNVSKTCVLPKGVTQQAAFDVAHNVINASPSLTHLSGDVFLASFCPEGSVGIGVH